MIFPILANAITMLLIPIICTVTYHSSSSATAFTTTSNRIHNTPDNHQTDDTTTTRSLLLLFARSKKTNVDEMAVRIGLSVVSKKRSTVKSNPLDTPTTTNKNTQQQHQQQQNASNYADETTINKKDNNAASFSNKQNHQYEHSQHDSVPTIIWEKLAKDFFWGHENTSTQQQPPLSSSSKPKPKRIPNKQSFPLFQLSNAIPPSSLQRILSLLLDDNTIDNAEEMEQHELINGKPRTLRRSLVSRLGYDYKSNNNRVAKGAKGSSTITSLYDEDNTNPHSNEILDLIIPNLPPALVGGMTQHPRIKPKQNYHPYEDGSVVYYRTPRDFYNTHHDSYAVGDDIRERQRAYTILIYLVTPPGEVGEGGTEFAGLDPVNTNKANNRSALKKEEKRGIMIKPKAGDALVWPNFDQNGKPDMNSIHRALSMSGKDKGNDDDEGKGAGKVVVNLWFEGRLQS